LIDNHSDIWDATKGSAGAFDLLVIRVEEIDARFLTDFASGAALDRDAQDFLTRRSTCDEIDSGMVYVSALKASLR